MAFPIEFKLFAPHNKAASLIGSFSDWQNIPMGKGTDGYFRIQINLEDGIYAYKFSIQSQSPTFQGDKWVDIIDPYTTDVDETFQISIS